MLLEAPRYADLLADQDDEDESEHGRLVVTSEAGWRTEMARWIREVRCIDQEADGSDSETETIVPHRIGVQA